MSDFIKITCISNGSEFDLIASKNNIARLVYGFNQLEFTTPFPNGEYHVSVTQKEFERLESLLLGGSNE
ncbi:TPA: hypothetical protein ACGVCM_001397 [Streptococcus agalactiae]|uniref:hypothetical protein n=1 Tax=Streptococcus TaxID=1301 RepID=UPI0002BA93CB|nr:MULTISPECIES: hypothetical protein [Streptococcus]QBX13858.1 hypothetical protein Javan11_0024 [Streptococcus phage Javan11]EPU85065.1 hypothetical protein SAG0317_02925 [Streptococcus agalactiae GB00219]EPV23765.1 hypothetical protein SAG0335_05525 [Streptococcus agalactiae GB00651]EPV98056.1 hypothetical protein SAG0039_05980 [Streptococcus agalactiae FSL S3-014]EPW02633.1 hypothetical protein SAG0043_07020 [Streptococcus agalactiae FSL S3-137]